MPRFHYDDKGRLRFYIPRKMARILKWNNDSVISAEIADDGTVVITEDPPNRVRAYFRRLSEYTMLQLPIKHMTGRNRMRLDLEGDDTLVVKFFE